MEIGIVGFGAAAIGIIETLKDTNVKIHVFEKSKDIHSSSISGIRSDGKLFMSDGMGGDIQFTRQEQEDAIDIYRKKLSFDTFDTGISFDKHSRFYKPFYDAGFLPVTSEIFHVGTDRLSDILNNIYQSYLEYKNIFFHFNSEILGIHDLYDTGDNRITLRTKDRSFKVDVAFICVGRSGFKLISTIVSSHKNILLSNNTVDIGIRYEIPNHIVEDLNKEMYEFKVKLRTGTGFEVRTFCNNPSGLVVLEDYEDFVTVNGHANSGKSSNNTNFAILCATSFTEPFNDPVGYGSYISRLSNILAGGKKAILQTFGDFMNSKRTKRLGRVIPTLDHSSYVMGDINLAMPRRILISIVEFIEKLDTVIPGIMYEDNLMYAIETKFYSNKIKDLQIGGIDKIFFVGDCSGHTRSITYATAHGKKVGTKFLNNLLRGVYS